MVRSSQDAKEKAHKEGTGGGAGGDLEEWGGEATARLAYRL